MDGSCIIFLYSLKILISRIHNGNVNLNLRQCNIFGHIFYLLLTLSIIAAILILENISTM